VCVKRVSPQGRQSKFSGKSAVVALECDRLIRQSVAEPSTPDPSQPINWRGVVVQYGGKFFQLRV